MNQLHTPRTNAAINASEGQWSFELVDCCRELERELTEAIKQRDALEVVLKMYGLGYSDKDLKQLAETTSTFGEISQDAAQREIKRRKAINYFLQTEEKRP